MVRTLNPDLVSTIELKAACYGTLLHPPFGDIPGRRELYKFFLSSDFFCTKVFTACLDDTLYKFFLCSIIFCTTAKTDLYKIFLGKIKICTSQAR